MTPSSVAHFPTTVWNDIREAQQGQERGGRSDPHLREAMNRLIGAYWRPVYCYLRTRGVPKPEAEDLTQGFFLKFLEKDWVGGVNSSRGNFRAFLKILVRRYAYDQTHMCSSQSRFEGEFVRVSTLTCGEDRTIEPASSDTAAAAFDREWKAAILAAVDRAFSNHYELHPDPDARVRYLIFRSIQLPVNPTRRPTQEEVADQFGVTREAVRYALKEVGDRYAQVLRQEIRDQVESEEEIEAEIRWLLGE